MHNTSHTQHSHPQAYQSLVKHHFAIRSEKNLSRLKMHGIIREWFTGTEFVQILEIAKTTPWQENVEGDAIGIFSTNISSSHQPAQD